MLRLVAVAVIAVLAGCGKSGLDQRAQVVEVDKSSYGRGQLLYENHCPICHDSRAHIRSNRKAHSPAEVQKWVMRWSAYLKLDWGEAEVLDVTKYLGDRYYKFGQHTN